MKTYKLTTLCLAALLTAACESKLTEKAELEVGVAATEAVSVDGTEITIKKGTPVEFLLNGTSDFISFFSGEAGSKYEYRQRTTVDAAEVENSTLTFSLWPQYGNAACTEGVLSIYVSDHFEGLDLKNFKADSVLVETHDWKELIPQAELPQAPLSAAKARDYSVDMKPYLGKKAAIAICYKAKLNTASQPRMNFVDWKITNQIAGGLKTDLYASGFGFAPLNMHYTHWKTPANLVNNPAYGTVINNTNGYWNLKSADNGNFYLHSSGTGDPLRYSWLVSKLLVVNSCSPDAGLCIKNINQKLSVYRYTYHEAGTYKATFLANSANYEDSSSVLRQLTIKVTD